MQIRRSSCSERRSNWGCRHSEGSRLLVSEFIGPYPEQAQTGRPERSADGNIGGIAAAGDHQSTDPACIVARVERVPAAVEKDFHAAGEIHRSIHRGHADIAEVAGGVARRNAKGTTEADRQVSQVPADTLALLVGFERRLGAAGELITKGHMLVDEVANRLNPGPTRP